jgi:exopolysaccharide biosynthesis polyprenyl glycosylphosphotransferase
MSETSFDAVAAAALRNRVPGSRSRARSPVQEAALAGAVRRGRDIAGSMLLLVLTLPLLLLVAWLIKLDSPGPVLYRQDRVGLHGRIFTLWKFRSMRVDAEAAGPRWAAERDPRVTRVGAVIRACRVDELPQLVNVLRGEMSLVGPRPERPHFTVQLARVIPRYDERTCVLPGVTGWAQVSYPYGASIEDARAKLDYDLYYLANRSLLFDLRILAATVRVVLFRVGAR